jgi:hypothetical protein
VPSFQVWAIAQVVADILGLAIQLCVLNHNRGYWIFSNALVATIPFICQMHVENLTFNSNETQDFDDEFKSLKVCMQKQVIIVLEPFLSFMLGFQPRKVHNMLALMLDP